MLRSIGKQSWESVESVRKKKWKRLRWGGFAEKEGFKHVNERVRGDGILLVIGINVSSITTA